MKKLLFLLLTLFTLELLGQSNEDPFYEVDPNLPMVEIESNETDCDRNRPSVNDMDSDKREALRDCMMDYLNSGNNPNWEPGDPLYEKNHIVKKHYDNIGPWHNGNEIGFFTGHRDYIQEMEQAMLANPGCEQFVPLPASEPNPPNGFVPEEFHNGSSLLEGFPENTGNGNDSDPNDGIEAARDINMQQLVVNSETCNDPRFPNTDAFAAYVEAGPNQHGAVHGAIGGSGTMSNASISPVAAIFWLWHAWVDDQYHCWQSICQGCDPAFVRSIQSVQSGEKVCFDLSKSQNVENFNYQVYDSNGNDMNVTPDNEGCILFSQLPICQEYTVMIEGTNSCSPDLQGHSDYTVHNFYNHGTWSGLDDAFPCIEEELQWGLFEWAGANGNDVTFKIKPNSDNGTFDVHLVHVNTGSVTSIVSGQNYINGEIPEINYDYGTSPSGIYLIIASKGNQSISTGIYLD